MATTYKNLPVLRESGDLNSDIIEQAEADVASITLSKSTASISVGEKLQLTATTNPGNAAVTYTSGTPANASVDNTGLVTGLTAGSSVITAKITHDSETKQATCTVTVTA